jgi:hypothetical protein
MGGRGGDGILPYVKERGHDFLRVHSAFGMGRFFCENVPIKINKQFGWSEGGISRGASDTSNFYITRNDNFMIASEEH